MYRTLIFFLLLSAVGLSCKDSDEMPSGDDLAAMQQETIEAYILENELDATRDDSGLYFIVEQDGSGPQAGGGVLSIYYTMSVLDGDEISFYLAENGDPLKLLQGSNAVVPVGLDTGLGLMQEGDTYRLILPSALAFGDLQFSTLIPANSIIDIQVELVRVQSEGDIEQEEITAIDTYVEDNDLNNLTANPLDSVEILGSELRYKRTVAGDTNNIPGPGEMVGVTYTATFLDDTQFDATSGNEVFEFTLGNGEVLRGLDEGVGEMERGENALLIMPSSLGYGASVRVIPDFLISEMIDRQVIPDYVASVGPYEPLIFDVGLEP